MCPFDILLNEQVAAFSRFQKTQVKRQLCARAGRFKLVEQFLVINGLRPFRKWTLFIDIFNAARQSNRLSSHVRRSGTAA